MVNKKEIVSKIENHIIRGGCVLGEKVKSIIYGGKHNISVGRYYTATSKKTQFAVITTGRRPEAHNTWVYLSAREAAREYVSFCGNDIAARSKFIGR